MKEIGWSTESNLLNTILNQLKRLSQLIFNLSSSSVTCAGVPACETDPVFNAWLLTDPIPTALSELSEDTTHRVVTDAEKITWNGKLDASNLGTVHQVLHGNPAGALTWSAVVEDDISLSAGSSTNNTIVGTHGFAPALSGVSTQFLRGDGAWAAPASVTVPNAYVNESFSYTANVAHSITHNFGTRPLVQAIDSSGDMVLPLTIHHTDVNTVALTFSDSATYDVIITMGSPPFTNMTIVSDSYVVLGGDYTIKQTAAGKTVTLPTAVGRIGKIFRVKNSSVGVCDVLFTGGQNADGFTDVTIPSMNSYDFQSDGTNYIVI